MKYIQRAKIDALFADETLETHRQATSASPIATAPAVSPLAIAAFIQVDGLKSLSRVFCFIIRASRVFKTLNAAVIVAGAKPPPLMLNILDAIRAHESSTQMSDAGESNFAMLLFHDIAFNFHLQKHKVSILIVDRIFHRWH